MKKLDFKIPFHGLALLAVSLSAGCAIETDPGVGSSDPDPGAQPSTADPCENTIAKLHTQAGTTVYFCELDDAAVGLFETGPSNAQFVDPSRYGCADELFAKLAPDQEIPRAITDACALRAEAERQLEVIEPFSPAVAEGDGDEPLEPHESPSSATKIGQDGVGQVQQAANYCGSGGDLKFLNEQCFSSGTTSICQPQLVSWHQRTCSATVGDWCRHAAERIASCGGYTHFRAWKGKSLSLSLDYWVPSGHSASWSMWAPSKPVLYGWYDSDFRFRGDSSAGASHRYTVTFIKN